MRDDALTRVVRIDLNSMAVTGKLELNDDEQHLWCFVKHGNLGVEAPGVRLVGVDLQKMERLGYATASQFPLLAGMVFWWIHQVILPSSDTLVVFSVLDDDCLDDGPEKRRESHHDIYLCMKSACTQNSAFDAQISVLIAALSWTHCRGHHCDEATVRSDSQTGARSCIEDGISEGASPTVALPPSPRPVSTSFVTF